MKYYLNFSIEEINSLTIHEYKYYTMMYRNIKEEEQNRMEEAKARTGINTTRYRNVVNT